jgi:protocatechuate 3,4-dioxygenase beta subunit
VNGCNPLPGAVVDIWQCDAVGVYSAFRDTRAGFDTREQKFLRGYQITNDHGEANFLTIYPGWYPGRAVHIHFKIQTTLESGNVYDFTSQLFFDESLTDEIHSHPPYTDNGQRNKTISCSAVPVTSLCCIQKMTEKVILQILPLRLTLAKKHANSSRTVWWLE